MSTVWVNPRQLTAVAEIARKSRASICISTDIKNEGIVVSSARGHKGYRINYYGKVKEIKRQS